MDIENIPKEAFEQIVRKSAAFTNKATAEKSISEAIDAKDAEIANWLNASPGKQLVLNHTSNIPTGISISRGARNALNVNGVRAILVRDPTMKEGCKILTGYPQ